MKTSVPFCETDFGHRDPGPDARFMEFDDEAQKMGQWNIPMALCAGSLFGFFAALSVVVWIAVGSL